jgi:Rod binding domain-containing protein
MNFSISPAIAGTPASPPAARMKAENAARDFEAVLITSLLESLQKTFAATEDAATGSDNYAAMGTQALASAMSAQGGIGIARMVLHQWQQTKVLAGSGREVTSAT